MKKSILAMCILALLCFLSCDISVLDGLLDKTEEKLLEKNTDMEDLKSKKGKGEVREGQAVHIYNALNGVDEVSDKEFSDIIAVKEDNVNFKGEDNIIIAEGTTEGFQWWAGSNEKTWKNLNRMSVEARDRVQKFYDTWLEADKSYKIADNDVDEAIFYLGKVREENKNSDNSDIIFEAEKKLDAVIEVWKKAKEVKEKAGKDLKAVDDYLSKVEATIEVFSRFLEKGNSGNDILVISDHKTL